MSESNEKPGPTDARRREVRHLMADLAIDEDRAATAAVALALARRDSEDANRALHASRLKVERALLDIPEGDRHGND